MSKSNRDGSPLQSSDAGVYVLVLRVSGKPLGQKVGALGELTFRPGYYCYVGSALRGLSSRLRRHLSGSPANVRWHIDYLTRRVGVAASWFWSTTEPLECQLSRKVREVAAASVDGFGCSDCRCRTHLYFFPADPGATLSRIDLSDRNGRKLTARRVAGRPGTLSIQADARG